MLPQYVVDKLILFTFAIQTKDTYLTDTNNNMSNSFLTSPIPKNEPVKSYGPKSTEKREIKAISFNNQLLPLINGSTRYQENNLG